jgi:hypothetical protein
LKLEPKHLQTLWTFNPKPLTQQKVVLLQDFQDPLGAVLKGLAPTTGKPSDLQSSTLSTKKSCIVSKLPRTLGLLHSRYYHESISVLVLNHNVLKAHF